MQNSEAIQGFTFQEIMRGAMEALIEVQMGAAVEIPEFVTDLSERFGTARNTPDQARPFIESIKNVAVNLKNTQKPYELTDDVGAANDRELQIFMQISHDIDELKASLDELVQVSRFNSAVAKFSSILQDEIMSFIMMTEEAIHQSQQTNEKLAKTLEGLEELG